MSFKNCAAQVVKLCAAISANIPLPKLLVGMEAAFGYFPGVAIWAGDTFRPTQLTHHFVTFLVINEIFDLDVQHALILPTFPQLLATTQEPNYFTLERRHCAYASVEEVDAVHVNIGTCG